MSRNLYKGGWVSYNTEARVIDSNEMVRTRMEEAAAQMISREEFDPDAPGEFVAGLDAAAVDVLLDPRGNSAALKNARREEQEQLEKELEEARAQLESVKQETQQRLEQAQIQIEDMRRKALEEARMQGQKQGYEEGMAQVQEMRNQCQAEKARQEAEYRQMVKALEPEFVENLTGIYEHIFKVDLGSYSQIVVSLLTDAMLKTENASSYIIHVSKKDYPQVVKAREKILEETGTLSQNLEIISDMTLSPSQCMIETEAGIYDCSLGTELEELGRKLKLLSYSGK